MPTSLSFLSNDTRRSELENSQAGAVVVSPAVAGDIDRGLISTDPYRTYAEISVLFDMTGIPFAEGIHLTAVIDDTAVIADDVSIDRARHWQACCDWRGIGNRAKCHGLSKDIYRSRLPSGCVDSDRL